MFERLTDRARKVMALANQEAQRFNHEYIGTEHILLGLVKEASGVGANVLKNLGIDLRKVRLEVEKLVKSGPEMVTMGKLPQTPRAKKSSNTQSKKLAILIIIMLVPNISCLDSFANKMALQHKCSSTLD